MADLQEKERKEFVDESNYQLRYRSGDISSDDKFISFIYELCRDHLTPGVVESIVLNSTGPGSDNIRFTNGYLAEYAKDVVRRLNNVNS